MGRNQRRPGNVQCSIAVLPHIRRSSRCYGANATTPNLNFRTAAHFGDMGEIRTVTTLQTKRDLIAAAIENYEKRLSQARADLAHVSAVIAIFEASGDTEAMAPDKRGKATMLCKEALAANGPMTTRALALAVLKGKGLERVGQGTGQGHCPASYPCSPNAGPAWNNFW